MNDIVILSPDELFARMIADECTFAGLPSGIYPMPDEHTSSARAVLIDLDHIRTIPASVPQVIGFFSDPTAITEELRIRCRVLFHRPFPVTELREELRRMFPGATVPAPQRKESLSCPSLTLDSIHMTAVCGGLSVPVSYREFTLIGRLLAANGETVSKTELSALLGGHDSNMTEVYICRLRRKIEKVLGVRLIECVRGEGYRLHI